MAKSSDNGTPRQEPERRLTLHERLVLEAIGDRRPLGHPDDPAQAKYPGIWEFLAKTDCPGNQVIEPATLVIRLADGGATCTLSSRALNATFDAASPFLGDLLDALERVVQDPKAIIRRSAARDPKVRKRKT